MFEPEFATCLRRMKSETNTLSPVTPRGLG
mgnify:CR=1 FL=1